MYQIFIAIGKWRRCEQREPKRSAAWSLLVRQIPVPPTPSAQRGRYFEHRHEYRNRDKTYGDGYHHYKNRLQSVGKGGYVAVHVLLVAFTDVFKRAGHVAGLFADGEHVGHKAGEDA